MKNLKLYLSILISLLINFQILYYINKKSNWSLHQSELNTGSNNSGIIQNINLINSMKTKLSANPTSNVKNTQVIKKPVVNQLDQKNSPKIRQQAKTPTSNQASGKASPQIQQAAKLKYSPPPLVYPPDAIEQNAIGKVTLKAFINADGIISDVQVIATSGYKVLDNAAIEWFKDLKFYPANNGEAPVGSFVSQTISFSLNDAKEKLE